MKLIIQLLILFTASVCYGLVERDKAFIETVNIHPNPGFEQGKRGFSITGAGTFTIDTATQGLGKASGVWDPSASGEFFQTVQIAIPEGLKGRTCGISFDYKHTGSDIKAQIYDGTSNLMEVDLPESTSWVGYDSLIITCPSSGTIGLRLESTADAAAVNLDAIVVGRPSNIGSLSPQDTFSAEISSTGVVSGENLDWIVGNCSLAASVYTCTVNASIFQSKPNCSATAVANPAVNRNALYDSSSSSTATVVFRTERTDTGVAIDNPLSVTCHDPGSAASQEFLTVETSGQFWAGNIHGANPSLGTVSVASYSLITDAGLQLDKLANSAPVQIGCASGTAPSGTTCSSDEAIAFAPTVSKKGDYMACFALTHNLNKSAAGGGAYAAFTVAETGLTDAVIAQQGAKVTGGTTDIDIQTEMSHHVCGILDFSTAGKKMVRLMYEQDATNVSSSLVAADRDVSRGQRDVYFYMYPLNENKPAALVTAIRRKMDAGANDLVTYTARITNSGTPTVSRQDGTWIDSMTDNATGDSTLNLSSDAFSTAPNCGCTVENAGNRNCVIFAPTTSSAIRVFTTNSGSGAAEDRDLMLWCTGPK